MPVHDPDTGALLGAIDLTGGSQVASPQTLALVRATVVAVENQLALLRLTGIDPGEQRAGGGTPGRAGCGTPPMAGHRRARSAAQHHAHRAARRHPGAAEPASGGAQRRSPGHVARRQGPRRRDHPRRNVAAAPRHRGRIHRDRGRTGCWYPITSDVGQVFDALEGGDVDTALSGYAGALLPQSVSPAIARLRTELSASLRAAVLVDGTPCAASSLARAARRTRRP